MARSARARYATAHAAGAAGRDLPPSLAAQADDDPLIDEAHDAGRNGVAFDDFYRERVGEPEPTSPRRPAPRGPKTRRPKKGLRRPGVPSLRQPLGGITKGASVGHSLAGVFLGAVAAALVINVIDYGPRGPKLWFDAKFLNKTVGRRPNEAVA
jgi:hypothetical protein